MKNGTVTDTTRIDRLAPPIEPLLDRDAKVIVMSHFGRPKGARDLAFSLQPLAAPLSRAIGGRDVAFAEDCIGDGAKRTFPRFSSHPAVIRLP
jgi:phosphoglycerate kinase